ncbi:hypothetical protein N7495_007288 [Penicillium taxi]|uniref:uncharacterized protein n=1 Tax=Penicillium taxi TaxID=168475 RepID=UPI0025451375|nr:uncharacterized protein N7495_007288 [Penicillium taxi]KAJ5895597.1 hypothetical protein N7495_007288 [Penicillium taxi]
MDYSSESEIQFELYIEPDSIESPSVKSPSVKSPSVKSPSVESPKIERALYTFPILPNQSGVAEKRGIESTLSGGDDTTQAESRPRRTRRRPEDPDMEYYQLTWTLHSR